MEEAERDRAVLLEKRRFSVLVLERRVCGNWAGPLRLFAGFLCCCCCFVYSYCSFAWLFFFAVFFFFLRFFCLSIFLLWHGWGFLTPDARTSPSLAAGSAPPNAKPACTLWCRWVSGSGAAGARAATSLERRKGGEEKKEKKQRLCRGSASPSAPTPTPNHRTCFCWGRMGGRGQRGEGCWVGKGCVCVWAAHGAEQERREKEGRVGFFSEFFF